MSDTLGAAAPAESTPAPVSDEAVNTPNPIDVAPVPKPEPKAEKEPAKPISTRDALLKAKDTVEKAAKAEDAKEVKTEAKAPAKDAKAGEVAKATEAKPDLKTEAKRDETGKFASDKPKVEAKPSYTAGEPPARFTADVKAKWAELPENVRGEVSRMERELTDGYQKHKAAAERDAGLNEFHDMAQKSGKQLPNVLREYVNMENLLRSDPVKGLNEVMQRVGISPRDYAAHILGQTPDQQASQSDATIRELKQTIAQLQQDVGGVKQTFQQQRESSTLQEVTKFAADNPRFEELSEDIAFFMKSGRAKDLSEAYSLAERLNPAAAAEEKPAASSAADLTVQTDKGQKSIKGSPQAGSEPAQRKPSTSIKESLRRAQAQVG